jgi:hypothetical protein
MGVVLLPEFIRTHYEVKEWRHACAILRTVLGETLRIWATSEIVSSESMTAGLSDLTYSTRPIQLDQQQGILHKLSPHALLLQSGLGISNPPCKTKPSRFETPDSKRSSWSMTHT